MTPTDAATDRTPVCSVEGVARIKVNAIDEPVKQAVSCDVEPKLISLPTGAENSSNSANLADGLEPAEIDPYAAALLLRALQVKTDDNARL